MMMMPTMENIESDPYFQQAKLLVDDIIDRSLSSLCQSMPNLSSSVRTIPGLSSEDTSYLIGTGSKLRDLPLEPIANIEWPTNEEFTMEVGIEKIEEFVKTWEVDCRWLYCIDYLGQEDHQYDIRHRYRVRYSVPTRRKPIPRATVSVYFTCSVSKILPKEHPINVFFVLETNCLVHKPGFSRFREQWLKDLIRNKATVISTIDF